MLRGFPPDCLLLLLLLVCCCRLCELNVLRQVFKIATSPVVASAWAEGQELHLYGVIYDVADGHLRKLAGPIRCVVTGGCLLQGGARCQMPLSTQQVSIPHLRCALTDMLLLLLCLRVALMTAMCVT